MKAEFDALARIGIRDQAAIEEVGKIQKQAQEKKKAAKYGLQP